MHTHKHSYEASARTAGRVIRWAVFYDGLVDVLTLGHARRLRTLTVEQARLQLGEAVLDVGCGTGNITLPAKQCVGTKGKAAGIDPAPEMIALARRKASRAGLEVDFRVGVIESLPFPDTAFDVVTSSLVIHHLPEGVREQGLVEILRVLKPGGRLLIADMTHPGTSFHQRLFASLTRHVGRGSGFGIEDLPASLEAAGFEDAQLLAERFLVIGFVRGAKPGR